MVCLACLLPLFLIPVANALPVFFDLIMGKIYGMFGWEYRKLQWVPPSCRYRPAAKQNSNEELEPLAGQQHPPHLYKSWKPLMRSKTESGNFCCTYVSARSTDLCGPESSRGCRFSDSLVSNWSELAI